MGGYDAVPGVVYSNSYTGNDCVYPFGVDPAWYLDPNSLTFFNSIKMRTSVIIGVVHMSMGVMVKGFNAVANKQRIVFIFEVLTGLIILNGLFGWMDFLVIYKWCFTLNPYNTSYYWFNKLHTDPAVISVMINNLMAFGSQANLGDVYFFPAQQSLSLVFVIMVAISVPLMLCVKPCAWAFCCKPVEDHHEEFDNIAPAGNEPEADEANQLIDTGKVAVVDEDDFSAYEKILN